MYTVTDHQNTHIVRVTTNDIQLNQQGLQFTRSSSDSSPNLIAVLTCANILDRSRNSDMLLGLTIKALS